MFVVVGGFTGAAIGIWSKWTRGVRDAKGEVPEAGTGMMSAYPGPPVVNVGISVSETV